MPLRPTSGLPCLIVKDHNGTLFQSASAGFFRSDRCFSVWQKTSFSIVPISLCFSDPRPLRASVLSVLRFCFSLPIPLIQSPRGDVAVGDTRLELLLFQ